MVKIVSRQCLGVQKVYDIGLAEDHNFLLSSGLVASNCFNKSHSTAYAYVTYQTAYLKANYPVEYMTALLSASSDNQEKVEKYRENCQRLKIEVQPPHINISCKDFTPDGNKILFGLSAVRNLGDGAIDNILTARANGPFTSLADFCERIDLRSVNSRAIETLINCGAFDFLNPNRKQLVNDLALIIPWAQNKVKEKQSGQFSIFDILGEGGTKVVIPPPSSPSVPDYTLPEKLKLEKENLGFYVSEHPLKSLQDAARILSPIDINQLSEIKGRKQVCCVVVLTGHKKHITKQGAAMGFVQIEDATGQVEGIVFASVYSQLEPYLQEDAQLVVWGKVEQDEEKVQLIIDSVQPVDSVKIVTIELSEDKATDKRWLDKLKSLLQEQSGDKKRAKVPVAAILRSPEQTLCVSFSSNFWVQNEDSAQQALNSAGFNANIAPLVS